MTGWLPYTYCQAQTWIPAACSVDTICGLNCDQVEVPSPLFMYSVPIPALWAWAMIDCSFPPLDAFSIQTHMPRPRNVAACSAPCRLWCFDPPRPPPPEEPLAGLTSTPTASTTRTIQRTRPTTDM